MADSALLKFVHISDTHLTPDMSYIKDYARFTPLTGYQAMVESINALPFTPDFILHTGDVAYDPEPEIYDFIRTELDALKAPVIAIAGNHDHQHALQRSVMDVPEDQLQANYHHELELNGVQILLVDSNAPERLPAGRVPDEQLDWLRERCTADDPRPLVVAVHHNVLPVGVPWLDDWMRMTNGTDFHAAVKPAAARMRGVFHGHIHQNIDTYADGVLYSAASSSWSQFMSYPIPENDRISPDFITPPGYSVVTVTEQRTYIRRHTFEVTDEVTGTPPAD